MDFDSTSSSCSTITSDVTTDYFLTNNYSDYLVYGKDIDIKTASDISYVQLNYGNTSNTYLTYTLQKPEMSLPSNYTSNKMYIFGLLHNKIAGIDKSQIVGEMVLKHVNTNGNIIYSCYLLKTGSTSKNAIDNILSLSVDDSIDTNLNNIFKSSPCYLYNDNNNLVIVFTNPIQINDVTKKYITTNKLYNTQNNSNKPCPLFSITPSNNYYFIENISPGDTGQIYIDCNPTGVGNKEILTYNVPVGSNYTEQVGKIDYMKTSMNFYIFTLATIAAYFFIPGLYKVAIINNLITIYGSQADKKVFAANILIIFAFAITISYLVQTGDSNMITIAIFIGVVFILSSALIMSKYSEEAFMTKGSIKIKMGENTSIFELFDLLKQIFSNADIGLSVALFILLGGGFVPYIFVKYGNDQNRYQYLKQGFILLIPAVIVINLILTSFGIGLKGLTK